MKSTSLAPFSDFCGGGRGRDFLLGSSPSPLPPLLLLLSWSNKFEFEFDDDDDDDDLEALAPKD